MRRWPFCLLFLLSASQASAQSDAQIKPGAATFEWGVAFTGEAFGGVAGGIAQKSTYLQSIDLQATLEVPALLPGAPRLHAHVLGTHGGDPSAFVGDVQTVSNIAADDAWRLFELWLESTWFRSRVSVLAGLYDLNSEFDLSETGSFFVNSSFGIGAEYGASGHHGPSIFPTTGLAARLRWMPKSDLYLQLGVFDGVPGDPERPQRTLIRLDADDGVLLAFQIGLLDTPTTSDPAERDALQRALVSRRDDPSSRRSISLGFWHYTGRFERILDKSETRSGSTGAYFLAEHELQPLLGLSNGTRCFVRGGMADAVVNRIAGSISGGCVADVFLRTKVEQQFGLAFTAAFNGNPYLERVRAQIPVSRSETVIELGYGITFTRHVGVQTSLQYVVDPDSRRDVPDALAAGLRLQLAI